MTAGNSHDLLYSDENTGDETSVCRSMQTPVTPRLRLDDDILFDTNLMLSVWTTLLDETE
jgi:hypothetical protein